MAHIVDDTLMRTTHVTRGEERLTSVPFHLQLFQASYSTSLLSLTSYSKTRGWKEEKNIEKI